MINMFLFYPKCILLKLHLILKRGLIFVLWKIYKNINNVLGTVFEFG